MKLPKSIRVLNANYKIKFDKTLKARNRCGECDLNEKIIYLDPELEGNSLKQTLWHELIHAYQYESGLFQFLETQAAEMMAESMANFIISVRL